MMAAGRQAGPTKLTKASSQALRARDIVRKPARANITRHNAEAAAASRCSTWFISYAWGDNSPEGRRRDAIVDRICEAAKRRGIAVRRDKTELTVGDSIDAFINEMIDGDRVIVILSDKYLRSAYCMYELNGLWHAHRRDSGRFRAHVKMYALLDRQELKVPRRLSHARYWRDKRDELDRSIQETGASLVSSRDLHELHRMGDFCRNVSDILGTFDEIVLPSTIAELEA